jgi:hypothetical protein
MEAPETTVLGEARAVGWQAEKKACVNLGRSGLAEA